MRRRGGDRVRYFGRDATRNWAEAGETDENRREVMGGEAMVGTGCAAYHVITFLPRLLSSIYTESRAAYGWDRVQWISAARAV